VSRRSHVHQMPQTGRAQIGPVTRLTVWNTTPTSAISAAPGLTSRLTGRIRAWKAWHACTGRGRHTCSGCVRATGAREARRAVSLEAGGSRCSGAAAATGTAWARSGYPKRCCSRTTAASRRPATGSRWYPRRPRRCGSAACRRTAGGSRAQAPPTRSRGMLMATSCTGRLRECAG